jgi:molybdenum cofactor cytidylyltransferase
LQALLLDKPVLEHTLDAVRASGLPFHVEAVGHPGMGDSIAAAVRATPDADGWLILPADLPLVQAQTLQRIAQVDTAHRVVVPCFEGQGGHPVRFAASCGPALMDLQGNQGAALILKALGAIKIEIDDAGCVTDIDTVQDLERAQQLLLHRRELGH